MKYKKIPQSQLDEIQALFDSKNEEIQNLKNDLVLFELYKTKIFQVQQIEEDRTKLTYELTLTENVNECINRDRDKQKLEIANLKSDVFLLKTELYETKLTLEIQKGINTLAIQKLNKCKTEELKIADVSGILDIKG